MRPPRSRAVRLQRGTKKPLDAGWPRLVLSDRLYLTTRKWWGCRAGNGLWILDFDAKEGHLDLLERWPELPGWHVRTQSGGVHVYLRAPDGRPRPARIAVEGLKGVELKSHSGQYVVWPTAPGYTPLSELALPLSVAPAWLTLKAPTSHGNSSAPALGGGSQPAWERERFGTPAEYVEALGFGPIEDGCIRCPAPEHDDHTPSCQVRAHNLRCWTHPGQPLTMRARQLAACSLGLGEARDGRWCIDAPDDRAAVAAHLDAVFAEVS